MEQPKPPTALQATIEGHASSLAMFRFTTSRETLLNSTPSMELPVTPDAMTRLLEDPFGTWQTALLFIILLVAFGSCAIFLGTRYAEVLRFDIHNDATLPLTLEGRRPKHSGNRGDDAAYLFSETPTTQVSHSQDDDQIYIRRRPGTANVQPNYVIIGEVREGMIAQRRASLPRGAGRHKLYLGTLH